MLKWSRQKSVEGMMGAHKSQKIWTPKKRDANYEKLRMSLISIRRIQYKAISSLKQPRKTIVLFCCVRRWIGFGVNCWKRVHPCYFLGLAFSQWWNKHMHICVCITSDELQISLSKTNSNALVVVFFAMIGDQQ